MSYDEHSYAGRELSYPPLYHYLLALFSLLFPLATVAKILPAILASISVLFVYLISYEITKDRLASLFASLLAAFAPLFIERTVNSASVYSLVIPMFFFMIYCLIKLREERAYLVYFVFLSILLPLAHPTSFLLLLVLIVYSLILASERLAIRRPVKEAIIFSILAILFIQFLIYRTAFLSSGISILRQSIPTQILEKEFLNLSLTQSIFDIGIIASIFGLIAMFIIFFTSRKDSHMLIVSIILATILSMLLGFLLPKEGMLFLALTLAILSSISLAKLSGYLNLTKLAHKKGYFISSIIFLSVILSIIPSYIAAENAMKNVPAEIDIEALAWIQENIEGNTVIAALPEEGNLIIYSTGKSNVMDDYYILAPDPADRFAALERLFTTTSEFEALDIANSYNLGYLFLSEKAKAKYSISDIAYSDSIRKCFDRRKYDDFGKIYQVRKC